MTADRLRRQIAWEAARLMYGRQESEYFRAKLKAARRLCGGLVNPHDLPTNREIRDQIQAFAQLHEDGQFAESDIISDQSTIQAESKIDRFQIYRTLLLPLEQVRQSPKYHPEGDVLCHSLQVFDLACDAQPYDEEFLLAALLHDVGKGIDPQDDVAAGLEALGDYITPRTAWLIEHQMEGHALADGTLGVRARRRLEADENYDDLVLLSQCERRGRQRSVESSDLDEAIEYVRELARTCGE
jgi:hypothetical protein